jgi:hypothetical protein
VLSLTTLSSPHKGSALADLIMGQERADVVSDVGWDLMSRLESPDRGHPDLTTDAASSRLNRNLDILDGMADRPQLWAVGADADLNNDGELNHSHPDEYEAARGESAQLRQLYNSNPTWDLSKHAINLVYRFLQDYGSVEIVREHYAGGFITVVYADPTCCGGPNDTLVPISSANGESPFFAYLPLNSSGGSTPGVDGADHAAIANGKVAEYVWPGIRLTERASGDFRNLISVFRP